MITYWLICGIWKPSNGNSRVDERSDYGRTIIDYRVLGFGEIKIEIRGIVKWEEARGFREEGPLEVLADVVESRGSLWVDGLWWEKGEKLGED